MSLAKIIGAIIAIPTIFVVIINWWAEGKVFDALLEAFGVHPILIAIISIIGIVILFRILIGIIS